MSTHIKGTVDLPDDIRAAIKRAYPTARYEEPDLDQFDRRVSIEEVHGLTAELAMLPLLTVNLELAEPEYELNHTLAIGEAGLPSWSEFNFEMRTPEKRALVQQRGGVCYWYVRLSRIAQYYYSSWNVFKVSSSGKIEPDIAQPPQSPPWPELVARVEQVLMRHGYKELDRELADRPVPWIDNSDAAALRSYYQKTPPTVYECVVSAFL